MPARHSRTGRVLHQERSLRSQHDLCGRNLEQRVTRWLATLDRLVPEAERKYLCTEHIVVHRESCIVHGNSHTFACTGHSTSPANPYRSSRRLNSAGRLGIHNGTISSRTRYRPKYFPPRSRGLKKGSTIADTRRSRVASWHQPDHTVKESAMSEPPLSCWLCSS